MQVKLDELQDKLRKVALKYVSEEEAEYFSKELSEAYVRKYPRSNVLKMRSYRIQSDKKNIR